MKKNQILIKAMQCYMLENDITQAEFARKIGVSQAAIGKWLIGHNGITMRNREKITRLCGKWMQDPADAIPNASDEAKNQLRTLTVSLGRASLAEQSGNSAVAAVENFRNLVIMAMYDIDMPAVIRSKVIRAVSNIEVPDLQEGEKK